MWNDPELDEMLREQMHSLADQETPSRLCKDRIWEALSRADSAKQRGNGRSKIATLHPSTIQGGFRMRRLSKIAIAIIACLMFTGTAYAAGLLNGVVKTSHAAYDYVSYDKLPQAEKQAGLQVQAPRELPGGFTFAGINLTAIADTDEDGNEMHKRNGLDLTYTDQNGHKLFLSTEPATGAGQAGDDEDFYQEKKEVGGCTLYYTKSELLYLPPTEHPTAEEQKRAQEDPAFSINYGTDKRETVFASDVWFTYEGVRYSLLDMEQELPAKKMFLLAEKIVRP
mgnify:FL=1